MDQKKDVKERQGVGSSPRTDQNRSEQILRLHGSWTKLGAKKKHQ